MENLSPIASLGDEQRLTPVERLARATPGPILHTLTSGLPYQPVGFGPISDFEASHSSAAVVASGVADALSGPARNAENPNRVVRTTRELVYHG